MLRFSNAVVARGRTTGTAGPPERTGARHLLLISCVCLNEDGGRQQVPWTRRTRRTDGPAPRADPLKEAIRWTNLRSPLHLLLYRPHPRLPRPELQTSTSALPARSTSTCPDGPEQARPECRRDGLRQVRDRGDAGSDESGHQHPRPRRFEQHDVHARRRRRLKCDRRAGGQPGESRALNVRCRASSAAGATHASRRPFLSVNPLPDTGPESTRSTRAAPVSRERADGTCFYFYITCLHRSVTYCWGINDHRSLYYAHSSNPNL